MTSDVSSQTTGPFDMDSAVLRTIFDHRIEKLTLSSGIPETLEELTVAVKHMLALGLKKRPVGVQCSVSKRTKLSHSLDLQLI
ncbi:hypothetical protein AOLI_G00182910 [Acnodon oligacanthus]